MPPICALGVRVGIVALCWNVALLIFAALYGIVYAILLARKSAVPIGLCGIHGRSVIRSAAVIMNGRQNSNSSIVGT
jgi:hypothetical protein